MPVIASTAEHKYLPRGYAYYRSQTGDILPIGNATCTDVVRTRLSWDSTSTEERPWIYPQEPGGEYVGLPDNEMRRRQYIYSFGLHVSVLQPGGIYWGLRLDELLGRCLIDGIMNMEPPVNFTPRTREGARAYLITQGREKVEGEIRDAIRENNVKLHQMQVAHDQEDIEMIEVDPNDYPGSSSIISLPPPGYDAVDALLPLAPRFQQLLTDLQAWQTDLQQFIDTHAGRTSAPSLPDFAQPYIPAQPADAPSRVSRPLFEWYADHPDPLSFVDALMDATSQPLFQSQSGDASQEEERMLDIQMKLAQENARQNARGP